MIRFDRRIARCAHAFRSSSHVICIQSYNTNKFRKFNGFQYNIISTYSNMNKKNDNSNESLNVVDGNNERKLSLSETVTSTVKGVVVSAVDMVKNPQQTWKSIKNEIYHYYLGTKLLWAEIKLTVQILRRVLSGHLMTRRERLQLIRTTNDLFRLVPFAVFVIVPFMEFLLPFALRIFPNMLPSTFQDSFKREETIKNELKMRLALAGFLQDALKEMVDKKKQGSDKSSAKEIINFIDRARLGEELPNDSVIRIAQLFKDELTLANIARPQLVSLCEYMNLRPYGSDAFLRFQIRNKIRVIKEDDRRILWEGIESLTTDELRDACRERGMRSVGLSNFHYRRQLQDWLELSTQKNIPISLLIMSRAFSITSKVFEAEEVIKGSISALTDATINEVVLASASHEENSSELTKRKLESLQYQSGLIDNEKVASEAAKAASAEVKSPLKVQDSKVSSGPEAVEAPVVREPSKENITVEKKILSVPEMEALSDLARGSIVSREKADLAKLEAHIESVESTTQTTSATDSKLNAQSPKEDKGGAKYLQTVLNNMVDKLRREIDSTEKALGNKLSILDLDGDGELSSEEIKNAVIKTLRSAKSENDAEEIVRILDKDADGKVSVVELLQYVESLKQISEVEHLEHVPPIGAVETHKQ